MGTGWGVGLTSNAVSTKEESYPPSERLVWRLLRDGCGMPAFKKVLKRSDGLGGLVFLVFVR